MKKYKISIPEPCNEGWSNMTPKDKGRYCSSCSKVVVDFTKMTDNEIIKLVSESKKAEKKICGHFRKNQVNRTMFATVPYKSRPTGFMITAALLTGLSFISCNAQEVGHEEVGKVEMLKGDVAYVEDVDTNVQVIQLREGVSSHLVSGAHIKVDVKGYEDVELTSGKDGKFEIKRLNKTESLRLIITHPLYDRKIISFTFGQTSLLVIRLNESMMIDGMVEGEMIMEPEIEPKK